MIIAEGIMMVIILIILLNKLSSFYELILYRGVQQLIMNFLIVCDIIFLLRFLINKKLRRKRLKNKEEKEKRRDRENRKSKRENI